MYIHIGQGKVIRSNDIIAFLDKKTLEYQREKNPHFFCELHLPDCEKEDYRTLIITATGNYLSPFTTRYFVKQLKSGTKIHQKASNV